MSKNTSLQITIGDGDGAARAECDVAKGTTVFLQRELGFSASIQVIEDRLGKPALRDATEILNVDDS